MKFKVFLGIILTLLVASIVVVSLGTTSPISIITLSNSTTTVCLDPPAINGTAISEEFTVNISISTSQAICGWMAGLTFNATVLNCTDFIEGEFLNSAGQTLWIEGTINNTLGVITAHGCTFLGNYSASGKGRLAYLTFKIKTLGVSDLHLRDVTLVDYYTLEETTANIIDVYTVVEVTPPQTVVTESNSTGTAGGVHSGLFGHSFSNETKELSFKVTGPYSGFSNVTIPKTLLSVSTLNEWTVMIDGIPLSTAQRTITENTTHYFIHLIYDKGTHEISITTTPMSSTISIALNPTSICVGERVIISGQIDPMRPNVTATILYRPSSGTWTTLGTNQTDSQSHYSYTWTPTEGGIYEVMAFWEGDENTLGAISDILTLAVQKIVYEIEWEEQVFYVVLKSNSTVSDFAFDQSDKQISFNVTGPTGTTGFCNVTIPIELLDGAFMVLIDDVNTFYMLTLNETHTFLHFMYDHSTYNIKIIGTTVIPEFLSFLVLPLFMIVSVLVITIHKLSKRKCLHALTKYARA
jgi:hypothetical protein